MSISKRKSAKNISKTAKSALLQRHSDLIKRLKLQNSSEMAGKYTWVYHYCQRMGFKWNIAVPSLQNVFEWGTHHRNIIFVITTIIQYRRIECRDGIRHHVAFKVRYDRMKKAKNTGKVVSDSKNSVVRTISINLNLLSQSDFTPKIFEPNGIIRASAVTWMIRSRLYSTDLSESLVPIHLATDFEFSICGAGFMRLRPATT